MSSIQKEEKEYILEGVISSPGTYSPNAERYIKITSKKKNIYSCTVPTTIPFSNYQEDDIIKCALGKKDDGTYYMLRKPFITLSTDKAYIERCFIRALRGTGFGPVAATNFYEGVRNAVKVLNVILPQPNGETVYGTDGVIHYISKQCTSYKESGDKEAVECLIACGLRDIQAKKLLNWWHRSRCRRRLHLLGLKDEAIKRCRLDCDEIYRICITKPLTLAPVSMDVCLFLLEETGITPEKSDLRCGEILRKIDDYVENSCYACVRITTMEWHFKDFFSHVNKLQEEYGLVLEGNLVYLKYNYEVELAVADYMDKLIKETAIILAHSKELSDKQLESKNEYTIDTLTEEQKEAIEGAIKSKISLITGPAGTGKSSIAKEIYHYLTTRGIKMVAGAYTGKAVVRLNEIFDCDVDALPVARTLDYMITKARNGSTEDSNFKVILIDEASMATTELIYRFISTFTHDYSIIIMGDCNQLPPIGWGFFMKQIIACGRVPIFTLTKNQRLRQPTLTLEEEEKAAADLVGKAPSEVKFDRTLLKNMEELIDPKRDLTEPMTFDVGSNTDMSSSKGFYILDEGIDFIKDMLFLLKQGGTSYHEITAICPYVKYDFIPKINRMFQDVFLAEEDGIIKDGIMWKKGDKIQMLRNNYNIKIFNGEEAIVTEVTEKSIKAQFKYKIEDGIMINPNKDFEFDFLFDSGDNHESGGNDLVEGKWEGEDLYVNMIQHSFCITIHKSQGSQYKYVVLFLPHIKNEKKELSSFLSLNLLYVGISRTECCCWLIGKEETLGLISMKRQSPRIDNLANRIAKMRDIKIEPHEYKIKATVKEWLQEKEEIEEEDENFQILDSDEEDAFWS